MSWFKKTKNKNNCKPSLIQGLSEKETSPQAGIFDGTKNPNTPVPPESESNEKFQNEIVTPVYPPTATPPKPEDRPKSNGYFKRLRDGLSKTRKIFTTDLNQLFVRNKKINADLLEELEELLITSDIGVATTLNLIEGIVEKSTSIQDAASLKAVLKEEVLSILKAQTPLADKIDVSPYIIMVVGVNGVGKTTTIGKLAAKYAAAGKKVLIAAADTFRAAAIEQLGIWAHRAGADFVKHKNGADPAAVAYDGMEAAMARGADIVLVDTAGRLHTRVNLMEELKKIKRTIAKKLPGAPHEVLLVLDATTGQNALSQAQLFNEALGVTAIALAKLDGTAKGGIVVSIFSALQIPIKYVGIGEKIEDLQNFDPEQFVNALF
ncbi:MAG: signal recognition particle-docking protein FtsY [Deltaproteobacteria bacterium]|nr:MAG: signal recognition particle-docking protein FtsY [Deltaproteobacteria bacterium]